MVVQKTKILKMCNDCPDPSQINGEDVFYTGAYLSTLDINTNTSFNLALQKIEAWAAAQVPNTNTIIKSGTYTVTANGSTLVFNIPHTVGSNPTSATVSAGNVDTPTDYYISTTSTNIIVTFYIAPASTTSISLKWIAIK